MKVTALVPMKAHSERVPNKNIRAFNGRPLYHWVVEALLASPYISEVVIDTDSDVLLEEAPKLSPRVRTIVRPEALRGDEVPMNAILLHDVTQCAGDYFLQTHSTSPLLTSATIDGCIEEFQKGDFDSLFTVTRLYTRLYDAEGRAINHDPEVLLRTQDLPPVFEENSALYVFTRQSLESTRRRIGRKPLMFEITREEASDIDVELDFQVAEFLHSRRLAVR